MPRALALFALSLLASLTITAVMTVLVRPEARRAVFDIASRCRSTKAEEASA